MTIPNWLDLSEDDAPLIVSLPHTGTEIPVDLAGKLVSPWLARRDTDWWLEKLYDFAPDLGATVIRTGISRTVIDVNRDPSGASLYPGQATTGLCPAETFDGDPLYQVGGAPDEREIERRRNTFFAPYHEALAGQIARLRKRHPRIVVYDGHSIRSDIPRLFDGILPNINIGTNSGASCSPEVTALIEKAVARTPFTRVTDGRFKGGWITRHYGRPENGVHAVQIELACRGYMAEPARQVSESNWPTAYDPATAEPMRTVLHTILAALRDWAASIPQGEHA